MAISNIKINGNKYPLGGSKLYKHEVEIIFIDFKQTQYPIYFEFVNESETPITQQQFIDYIHNYNYPQNQTTYFDGLTKGGNLRSRLSNNYYGGNYSFYLSITRLSGTTINELTLEIGEALTDEIINTFIDKVTPFITEV